MKSLSRLSVLKMPILLAAVMLGMVARPGSTARGQTPDVRRAGEVFASIAGVPTGSEGAVPLVPLREAARRLPALTHEVSLQLEGVTVEYALNHVARRAGLDVLYDGKKIDVAKRVTLDLERVPAYEALRAVLRGTGLGLKALPGGQLVLVLRPEAKVKPQGVDLQREAIKLPVLLPSVSEGLAEVQGGTITGTVTDAATGETLPGVNVVIEGTQQGAATDANGQYTIPGVEVGTYTLVASFVGYDDETKEAVEVVDGETTVVNFTLERGALGLDEVVVVGYGTQERQNITGAVASLDVAEANVGQNSSLQNLMQGRMAGVRVISNSGAPGSGMAVRVRGYNSITAGSDPLYVVDGVPLSNTILTPSGQSGATNTSNPLVMLNPQDIESIVVLKDAAATAIYGSQGANGVVLIETKSGAGLPRVSYSGTVSVNTPAKTLDVLTADEYRTAQRNIFRKDVPQDGPSTDWQEQSMRSAISHEHYLSFSGGTEQTSYFASLGYLNEEGLLLDSGFRRVSGRLNADHSMLDGRVRFNLNLSVARMVRNHSFYKETGGASPSVIKDMLSFDPTRPVRQDGKFFEYAQQTRNPVAMLKQITDITHLKRILGNFSVEIDLLENLTAKGTFGIDLGSGIRRSYFPSNSAIGRQVSGIASQSERRITHPVIQATLHYNRDLLGGDHSLGLLGGFEFQRETFQHHGVEVHGFITDATLWYNLGSGTSVQTPSSGKARVDQLSFFGRLNYTIQDKYLLTVTVRRDGSSVFGRENKFAFFPSASVGWKIAQEPFLDVEGLTQLKLRASYGISGNQGVPPYQSLALLRPSRSFTGVFGRENEVIGVAQARAANPDLKWEETREVNVGLDFGFFGGRVSGAINYYRSHTYDLLLNTRVVLPAPSPFILENVGKVSNVGIEFAIEALAVSREDVSLTVSANASSNRNEIEDLGSRGAIDHSSVGGRGLSGVTAQRLEAGYPVGSFYGPVFVGINESGQEVYKDGEGGTTTSAVEAVKKHIGNPIPDLSYGFGLDFQYKGFRVNAFFRGQQGRELFNNTALLLTTKTRLAQGLNILHEALDDGTSKSQVPTYSSRWVQDASFLRLDRLTLGYTFPDMGQYHIQRVRIYVTAQNLFVLTPYSGYDPEVSTNATGKGLGGFRGLAAPSRGIDYTSYPRPRTFTLGVEVGF